MLDENEKNSLKLLKHEERRNVLNALGLFETNRVKFLKTQEKSKPKPVPIVLRKRKLKPSCPEKTDFYCRKSVRKQIKGVDECIHHASMSRSLPEKKVVKIRKILSNTYGSVKGVSIGDTWYTRLECSRAGAHRPTIAGIHSGKDGAYSITLSGEYENDEDCGYCFTYTGSGGRDVIATKSNLRGLKFAPQSKDQTPDGANGALIRSIQTKNPVRVIRGHRLKSAFAPSYGYRYDGLYTVEKYWTCPGKTGFLVYRFLLKRCPCQPPAPWDKFKLKNKIKILKLRKKQPCNTVMNVSGHLSMSSDGKSLANNCQVNGMKLNVNSSNFNGKLSHLPTVFIKGECKVQLTRSLTSIDSTSKNTNQVNSLKPANSTCIIKLQRNLTDDNKENNRVIIKTRWRRSRMSLPDIRTKTPGTSPKISRTRRCKQRYSYNGKSSHTRRNINSFDSKIPPSIELFNVPFEKSYKWSLFASEAEIKRFQRRIRKNNQTSTCITDDDDIDDFRGFEEKGSFNKLMVLGFLINDLESK